MYVEFNDPYSEQLTMEQWDALQRNGWIITIGEADFPITATIHNMNLLDAMRDFEYITGEENVNFGMHVFKLFDDDGNLMDCNPVYEPYSDDSDDYDDSGFDFDADSYSDGDHY